MLLAKLTSQRSHAAGGRHAELVDQRDGRDRDRVAPKVIYPCGGSLDDESRDSYARDAAIYLSKHLRF